jgi:hypothetical protein
MCGAEEIAFMNDDNHLPRWAVILKAAYINAQQDAEHEFIGAPASAPVRAVSQSHPTDRPRQRNPDSLRERAGGDQ